MTNSKLTYAMVLDMVLAGKVLGEAELEKIQALKSSIEKKNAKGGEKKLTSTQKANEGLKQDIFDALEVGKAYTVSEMLKTVPSLADVSNQKASAMVRQMVADGLLTRTEIKRKAYFSRVED